MGRQPGFGVAQSLHSNACISRVLEAGFELALVRDATETLGFLGCEVELLGWEALAIIIILNFFCRHEQTSKLKITKKEKKKKRE